MEKKDKKLFIVGIDLGTTNSAVSVWDYDLQTANVVHNKLGHKTTPSVVGFDPNSPQVLVGKEAVDVIAKNQSNTIYSAKRFMSKKIGDPQVQKDQFDKPYRLCGEEDNDKMSPVCIQIDHNNESKKIRPEGIGAHILGTLVADAQRAYADKFEPEELANPYVVISVPAYFTQAQKDATKEAGARAGLNVIATISEPTAAALSYGIERKKADKDKRVLIFDLGGGTFDVTIMDISKEPTPEERAQGVSQKFNVLATGGDDHLGGDDFDNAIYHYAVDSFFKEVEENGEEIEDCNINQIPNCKRRVMMASKAAKHDLAGADVTNIVEEDCPAGYTVDVEITKDKFYQVTEKLIERARNAVQECLDKCLDGKGLTPADIQDVIPVGGSCRIIAIKELLQKHFSECTIDFSMDFDTSISYGACVYGAVLKGLFDASFTDIIPYAIGPQIKKNDDFVLYPLIPENSPRDKWFVNDFMTATDNDTKWTIVLHEGTANEVIDTDQPANQLGEMIVDGLPARKAGKTKVTISLMVDQEGTLHAKAAETGVDDGARQEMEIILDDDRISGEQMNAIVQNLAIRLGAARQELNDQIAEVEASDKKDQMSSEIAKAKKGRVVGHPDIVRELAKQLKTAFEKALQE